jgi:hypothetical protein
VTDRFPRSAGFPDGGRRDRHAEFRQFTVDPAVSPSGFLREANDKAGDARDRRRAAGPAPPARVVLSRCSHPHR